MAAQAPSPVFAELLTQFRIAYAFMLMTAAAQLDGLLSRGLERVGEGAASLDRIAR